MAYKMKGSPAKLGTIKGTTGHSSALKQKKSETIERIKKEMDPKVEEALRSFDRPTPGIKTKKPSKEQIKKILEKMKSIKGSGVQLSDDHKKTIEGVEKMIKDQKSPAKQKVKYEKAEPAPRLKKEQLKQKVIKETTGKLIVKKKSPAKQEGPVDEKNPDLMKGEMEGTAVYGGKDIRERIIDLEDRAEFAMQDAENSEGEEKKKHLANMKKLQNEADILRNRKPN